MSHLDTSIRGINRRTLIRYTVTYGREDQHMAKTHTNTHAHTHKHACSVFRTSVCVCVEFFMETLLCFPGDKGRHKGPHRAPEGEPSELCRLPVPRRGPQQEVPEASCAQSPLEPRGGACRRAALHQCFLECPVFSIFVLENVITL